MEPQSEARIIHAIALMFGVVCDEALRLSGKVGLQLG
jgi:hypothetical protein